MPQTQYNLHLKGFVGSADFDPNYVDYILAKSAILYLFFNTYEIIFYAYSLKRNTPTCCQSACFGGVREIRTPEPLLTVTRFPGIVKNLQILMAESDANADFELNKVFAYRLYCNFFIAYFTPFVRLH